MRRHRRLRSKWWWRRSIPAEAFVTLAIAGVIVLLVIAYEQLT